MTTALLASGLLHWCRRTTGGPLRRRESSGRRVELAAGDRPRTMPFLLSGSLAKQAERMPERVIDSPFESVSDFTGTGPACSPT